jgi:hypothetical protein
LPPAIQSHGSHIVSLVSWALVFDNSRVLSTHGSASGPNLVVSRAKSVSQPLLESLSSRLCFQLFSFWKMASK